MCSGHKFVKTHASYAMCACRCCMIPLDVVSTTAYRHPASAISRRRRWSWKRPTMVIFVALDHVRSATLKNAVVVHPVFAPDASSAFEIRYAVVVLPLAPVTPMTMSRRLGCPYHIAASQDSALWYRSKTGRGMTFRKKFSNTYMRWEA